MIYYHHTLLSNLAGIRKRGLLCRLSRGKRKACWVHTSSMIAWACKHMLDRRIGGVDRLVCIAVNIPRSWLKRYGKGVYYIERDIPAERIVSVVGYTTRPITD